jgi:hypothetical protein
MIMVNTITATNTVRTERDEKADRLLAEFTEIYRPRHNRLVRTLYAV